LYRHDGEIVLAYPRTPATDAATPEQDVRALDALARDAAGT
jgi:hypothetical protein